MRRATGAHSTLGRCSLWPLWADRHTQAHTLAPGKPYLSTAKAAFDNVELRAGLSQPVIGKVCDGVRDSRLGGS